MKLSEKKEAVQPKEAAIQPRAPFEEVKVVSFSFSGVKTREDAAFIQYRLLLMPEVLQAHIDFASKRGLVARLAYPNFSTALKKLGLVPKFTSMEWIPYADFVRRNSSFAKK